MKPTMDHVLISMATTLGLRIVPAMPETSYALGDARMVGGLAVLLAQEVDRAADVLARENATLRALFVRAASLPVGALAPALASAGASSDSNLRVSVLEQGNATLKALLIDLHIVAEESDADWAETLNREIWALLKQGAEDRELVLPSI